MLLSAKTGRVRETTPLRRLSHKFEEMKNRVIIHRLHRTNKKSTNGKVKTGDNNRMILYTVSLVLSLMIAAGCIYTIISKRRKNR